MVAGTEYTRLMEALEGLLSLEDHSEIMDRLRPLRSQADEYINDTSLTWAQHASLIMKRVMVLHLAMRMADNDTRLTPKAF